MPDLGVSDYIEKLNRNPSDWKTALEFIKFLRLNKLRRPDAVSMYGHNILNSYRSKLDEKDVYLVLEQVAFADLDLSDFEGAEDCVRELLKTFPDSKRVTKLVACVKEAKGDFKTAEDIYDDILSNDSANMGIHKRKIAILKAQGKTSEVIEALTKYLKTFMTDVDAWLELGETYLSVQKFSKAQFCFEELIINNPQKADYHLRLAEILYTQGGLDNLKLARKYYAQALEFHSDHGRALYGLLMTTIAVGHFKGGKDEMNSNLQKYAMQRIKKLAPQAVAEKLDVAREE